MISNNNYVTNLYNYRLKTTISCTNHNLRLGLRPGFRSPPPCSLPLVPVTPWSPPHLSSHHQFGPSTAPGCCPAVRLSGCPAVRLSGTNHNLRLGPRPGFRSPPPCSLPLVPVTPGLHPASAPTTSLDPAQPQDAVWLAATDRTFREQMFGISGPIFRLTTAKSVYSDILGRTFSHYLKVPM